MKTTKLPRNERYLATIEFTNGKSAQATSGNLKQLIARLTNNLSGETSDWGIAGGDKVVAYEVADRWADRKIVASKDH